LSSRRSENDGTISAASKLTSHPSGFRSQHVSDPRLERGGWPVHAPYRSGHAIGDSALPAARGRRSANASAQPKKTKRDSAKRGLAKTASDGALGAGPGHDGQGRLGHFVFNALRESASHVGRACREFDHAWITRQFLSRIGLSHRRHDMCDPYLSLRKNATWYGLGQPASWRSSNTWMSFSSRLGNRLRKATTTSGVGSLMQARLHLRPSHEHFSELISACAAPVARSSAATPAWNNFFMVVSLKDAIVSNHRRPPLIGRRPRLARKGRALPTD